MRATTACGLQLLRLATLPNGAPAIWCWKDRPRPLGETTRSRPSKCREDDVLALRKIVACSGLLLNLALSPAFAQSAQNATHPWLDATLLAAAKQEGTLIVY